MLIGNPRWPPSQEIDLTLDTMEKCSNAFFSETTNMIKANLYMNVQWMVLYKLDHPRNIPSKFGSNWPSGFGEEA
jgi:hypothetical protein